MATTWIIGSSIVKWARNQAMAQNHYLSDRTVLWYGKGGMLWDQVAPVVRNMLSRHAAPRTLIIHAGGNNLGRDTGLTILDNIIHDLQIIQSILPRTRILFSGILPRREYRGAVSNKQG